MHNLASSPYAAYKPPSNITTGTYDCRIHSRARICWCNYQYVRFPIRFVQPSYGTLPFPAAILRIVQINSLRCFVSLHSKQTQSRIPKISLPPLPPVLRISWYNPRKSRSESACRNPSVGSASGVLRPFGSALSYLGLRWADDRLAGQLGRPPSWPSSHNQRAGSLAHCTFLCCRVPKFGG